MQASRVVVRQRLVAYQMESPQGSTSTEHNCSATKGMPCQLYELPFLLEIHAWAVVIGQHLELGLDFINVLPDRLRYCQEVLMQLTAAQCR